MQPTAIETFRECVCLIQLEFDEMPGLHLSRRQAQRLWNLDAGSADAIFDVLEASRFLKRTADDLYIRADVGR